MSATITESARATTCEKPRLVTTNGPDFSSHPEYFRMCQQVAWESFAQLPWPARTDEAWRFADVKAVALDGYLRAEAVSDAEQAALLAKSEGLAETSGSMVFANDRLLARHFHGDALRAKGVLWLPLEQAIAEQQELIDRHFMREEAILGSRKFAALHASQVRAGTFLYVPRGVEIALPVETFHWLSGERASVFPHTLIIAEDNAKVTVVDHFGSADGRAGLSVGVNDIYVGSGARVTYLAVQNWSRQTTAFHLNNTVVQRDANALALRLNLGGALVRDEAVSHLRGPGGRSDMLSVSAAEGTQLFDQRTLQIHEQPNTASDLLYKNALNDKARTIFTGLIRVDKSAHKTDAYQKVRNLILSDEAEANSAPGLEIEADDVRCTHGATSGALEGEELFYLQSRGIPQRLAQHLITFGFLSEVFDRVPDPAVRGLLTERLHGKLG
jgi:Fe-S cluster assembly protein SufD